MAAFDATNVDICENLYANGGVTGPYFSYTHNSNQCAAATT